MSKVISKDGTEIAYNTQGQGPIVVLIDGALGYRSFGSMPELANYLSKYFTVVTYDRRGRGESGDTKPYDVEREVEDIDELIIEVGGAAYLYGISSGACLALEAAIKLGDKVKKLAIYEAPYNNDEAEKEKWMKYTEQLTDFLATNRRGDAVALFMAFVGTPADQIEGMRKMPMWLLFEAIAPTLAYDAFALGGANRSITVDRISRIIAPTLVMHGGAGVSFIKQGH